MEDITGDDFSLNGNEILKIDNLSLDALELENVFFNENEMYKLYFC